MVAVTGPAGEIGRSLIAELERSREVGAVRAMGRRALDPAAVGWQKTEYMRGDICRSADVEALIEGVDVVVHLAFVKFGSREHAHRVNLAGSRNVFEAAVAGGLSRVVYTSSVAAYGFEHGDTGPLSEEVPAGGSSRMRYSAQKGELEGTLQEIVDGTAVDAYVLRPCIVAGTDSLELVTRLPYVWAAGVLPPIARRVLGTVAPRPVLPDFGIPVQLVHADDVAVALRAAVLGRGEPGVYNLAAPGQITSSDLASALDWRAIRLPRATLDAAAEAATRIPIVGERLDWMHALRAAVLVDSGKARALLGWRARHDAAETLRQTVAEARRRGLLGGSAARGNSTSEHAAVGAYRQARRVPPPR